MLQVQTKSQQCDTTQANEGEHAAGRAVKQIEDEGQDS
jgi:hypothetical protein